MRTDILSVLFFYLYGYQRLTQCQSRPINFIEIISHAQDVNDFIVVETGEEQEILEDPPGVFFQVIISLRLEQQRKTLGVYLNIKINFIFCLADSGKVCIFVYMKRKQKSFY